MGRFLNALKREQTLTETVMNHQEFGRHSPAKRRKIYRDYNIRLKNIVTDYSEETDILRYLRAIANSLRL